MNNVGKSISRERNSMCEDAGLQKQCLRGTWPFCRGHAVRPHPGLWLFDFLPLWSRNLSVTQMPLSPPAEASFQPTQPCQQCQLIAWQLQSTKRERIRNGENSHRSHRGHLAGGRAVGRALFPLPFLPIFHRRWPSRAGHSL